MTGFSWLVSFVAIGVGGVNKSSIRMSKLKRKTYLIRVIVGRFRLAQFAYFRAVNSVLKK